MARVRAVLFNIYKTLIDISTDEESPAPYLFLCRWLSYHGMSLDPRKLRLRYLELCNEEMSRSEAPFPDFDIGKVFARILLEGGRPDLDVPARTKEMALLFRIATTGSITLYPGVHDLLARLKGAVRLGIVSNAQRLFTMPELRKFGLLPFFDAIALSSDLGMRKPDPEIFRHLLHALDVAPEEAVFVGDSLFDDVKGAKGAGMKTIWMRRGEQAADGAPVPATPDHTVLSGEYRELSEILRRILA